jgi:hypothetical protein
VEQQIIDAGAQIIWMQETDSLNQPGTAQGCRNMMDSLGSTQGWCVGDGETQPVPGTFDTSPFGISRGFTMLVPRQSMVIEYTSNPAGSMEVNELGGEELLALVQALADLLP